MPTALSTINASPVVGVRDLFLELLRTPDGSAEELSADLASREFYISLCSLTLRLGQGRNAYGPLIKQEGATSTTLKAFADLEFEYLQERLSELTNVQVRARLLDVMWCIAPKRVEVGSLIGLLIEAASGLASVSKHTSAIETLGRAIDLLKMARMGAVWSPSAIQVADFILRSGLDSGNLTTATRSAALLARCNDVMLQDKWSTLVEALFSSADSNPTQFNDVFSSLYRIVSLPHAEDMELRQRAALTFETLAERAKDSARATFFRSGIHACRNAPALQEIEARLIAKLEADSFRDLFHLRTFSHEIDLQPVVADTLMRLKDLPFGAFVFGLCAMVRVAPTQRERERAQKHLSDFALQAAMHMTQVDDGGRTVFRAPGVFGTQEEYDARVRYQMSQSGSLSRSVTTAGVLRPALHFARFSYLVPDEAIAAIAGASAFVKASRRDIFADGLIAFFAQDFIAASRILIPEIEAGIRHVLDLRGVNTYDLDENEVFVAQGLGAMLARHASPLEALLSADWLFLLEDLLVYPGGASLRNVVAHGFEGHNGWDADSIFGSFIAFQLCCGFIPQSARSDLANILDEAVEGRFDFPPEAAAVSTDNTDTDHGEADDSLAEL